MMKNSKQMLLGLFFLFGIVQNSFSQIKKGYSFALSGNTIYAGTNSGVYRSIDNKPWEPINNGLLVNYPFSALAVSGNYLFAGTEANGLYLSSNKGDSWKKVEVDLPSLSYITSILVVKNTVFFSTDNKGIYASSDNGITWKQINTGLASTKVQTLGVSGNTLLAGTKKGIFISNDNGQTWVDGNSGIEPIKISSFIVDGTTIYAGGNGWSISFHESTNNGLSWIKKGEGLKTNTLSSMGRVGNNLFAGTVISGMYISEDKGVTWTEINNGLDKADVKAMITKGDSIIIGTNKGIFLSVNNGRNWNNLDKILAGQSSSTPKVILNNPSNSTETPKDEILVILKEMSNEFSSLLGALEKTDGNTKYYKTLKTLKSTKSSIKEINENNSTRKVLEHFYDYKTDDGLIGGATYLSPLFEIINARIQLGMYKAREFTDADGRGVTEIFDTQFNRVMNIKSSAAWGLEISFYSKNWGQNSIKPSK